MDELFAKPIQQSSDDVAIRSQVARRKDFFFEDVVWREDVHMHNNDGNGCSVFGGRFLYLADAHY